MTIFKQGLTIFGYNTNIESLSSSKITYSNWVIYGPWVQIWPQLRIKTHRLQAFSHYLSTWPCFHYWSITRWTQEKTSSHSYNSDLSYIWIYTIKYYGVAFILWLYMFSYILDPIWQLLNLLNIVDNT